MLQYQREKCLKSELTRRRKISQTNAMKHSYNKTEISNKLAKCVRHYVYSRWYVTELDSPEMSLTSRRQESLVHSEISFIRTDCRSDRASLCIAIREIKQDSK